MDQEKTTSLTQKTQVSEAFALCEKLTKTHYENFPVGSRLIHRSLRPHICNLYAFARTADDFADEPGITPEERLNRLNEWETCLKSCLTAPRGPIFTALAETIRCHRIPINLLSDLLTAFRMDVMRSRHETFADLLTYCQFSAIPIGRLILHLHKRTDETSYRFSDAICIALQLTNFWQDIEVDFSRGRIYLPRVEMNQYGVTEEDIANKHITSGFRSLLNYQIERTENIFRQGQPLLDLVNGRLKFELRLIYLGGLEILTKIIRNNYDIFRHRPQNTTRDWTRILFQTVFFKRKKGKIKFKI